MFEGILDKENSLTFHNISRTMKANRSRKSGLIQQHKRKTDTQNNSDLECSFSRLRNGDGGRDVPNQLTRSQHSKMNLLTNAFQAAQERIEEQIHFYNCRYQKLVETITDMQIRDLIAFNRIKEQNRVVWKQLKEEAHHSSWDRVTLAGMFANQTVQPIFERIDELILEISESKKSQQSSQVRSRIGSPLPASKTSSPHPYSKNRSEIISPDQLKLNLSNNSLQGQPFKSRNKSRQSFVSSRQNTGSQQSKNSLVVQEPKKDLQDTPESVKMMVSQGGIGVTNKMATTMFQKIDICQSLNICASEDSKGDGSVCSLKSKNRYGEDNQQ